MKKIITILAAVFLMAMAPASSWSRNIVREPLVRTITMNTGLPSNAVRSIVQDKNGFIWFGTDNGLCRYDGYHVQNFYNPQMQFDQYVSTLEACDEGLLVGTSKGAFLFNFETEQFQRLNDQITSIISYFSVDDSHNVWVSTLGQGLFRYNLTTHECRHYQINGCKGEVVATLVDVNNQVWALCNHLPSSLVRLNKANDSFEMVPLKGDASQLYGIAMLANSDGSILVGTWGEGLFQVDTDGSTTQLIKASVSNSVHHIHKLYNDRNINVLIGSDDGLVEYDIQKRSWRMVSEVENPSRSSAERFVYSITSDKEGGLWIGTFYGGVSYIPSPAMRNRFEMHSAGTGGQKGNVVGRFAEDARHRIWVATDDAGVDCFDPSTDSFVDFPGKQAVARYNVHGLLAEGDDLWIGTYGNGIFKMSLSSGALKNIPAIDDALKSSCYCLFRDSRHQLWATSMSGACLLDEQKQAFRLVKQFGSLTIDIKEDKKGNIWFATQGMGLWCYRRNKTWKQYLNDAKDTTSICSNQVNCVQVDSKGRLLVATNMGLCEYQPSSDSFRRIAIDAPSQDFASIIINQDEMWISSDKGLIKWIPGEPTLLFNRYDGLTCDQFMPNASLLASDGKVYLGTTQGFNTFYPYQVKINHVVPPVAITSLELFNKRVEVGSEKLPESLNHIEQLNLSYDENILNLSFAALSYVSPEKNLYSYMLEGFDKDWVTTNEHRATYTNLPAGTYTFRVKAANNDGVWSQNEAKLKIVVHPPFWWSLPAKILYLLIIGWLIWFYTQSRVKREKRRHQEELDHLEEKQEQEMRDARLQFFTMIAHEIRTPVTLIIGPLENLKEQWLKISESVKDGEAMNQTLNVIDRNAQRLLTLVNQLLDFNKVQQKGLQVHFRLQNISKLMHAVAERFEPTLQQKGARLEVDYPADDFSAIIDSEAITKVISNLMTNATKYTRDYVHLSCRLAEDGEHFIISVEDNGMGISPDEQEKIFAAFYQTHDNKPGTGIGLNIVKNLVEAHHGMVEVKSEEGKGATFIVTLPVNQEDAVVEKEEDALKNPISEEDETMMEADGNPDEASTAEDAEEAQKGYRPTMLIVDDDEDMRNFVQAHFAKTYRVLTAEDGKQALRILNKCDVTLIVSDWMMPEMDGPEFCRSVRMNPKTSHLPFIMLTAKTDDASKAEGMNCGADIFIEKPFSMKYLEASVNHLIEMRRLLKSKFSHTPLEPIQEIAPTKIDNDFLVQMEKVIEENLSNPEMNVAFLAARLGMSRSSLFNKIRGLADVTPNEMIQVIRLKKAARLLREKHYRISEVSYMVGFSSPSYFTKCFQKQFGMKPAEFAEMG